MARSYGRFTTGIFRDADFRALSAAEQGVYFMLGLQPEMTAAGTLPLTLRRWSNMSTGMTPDELSETLSVLAAAGHLVIDWDTEEVLIRKFIKWDGGIGNTNRRPVVREAALAIESPRLRHAVALELTALGHADMALEVDPDAPVDARPDAPMDAAPDAASTSDRSVVNQGDHIPHPLHRNPHSAPSTPVGAEPPTTAQTIVGEWIDRSSKRPPGQVVGQVAKLTDQMLAEGIDADDIRRGLAAWMTKGLHPSTLPSVVNEVMNAPSMRPPTRRGTDDKVRDGLALAQRLATEHPEPPRQIGASA